MNVVQRSSHQWCTLQEVEVGALRTIVWLLSPLNREEEEEITPLDSIMALVDEFCLEMFSNINFSISSERVTSKKVRAWIVGGQKIYWDAKWYVQPSSEVVVVIVLVYLVIGCDSAKK